MFVGRVRDITERLEGENAAYQLTALVESSAEAIVAIGLDGTVMQLETAAPSGSTAFRARRRSAVRSTR